MVNINKYKDDFGREMYEATLKVCNNTSFSKSGHTKEEAKNNLIEVFIDFIEKIKHESNF